MPDLMANFEALPSPAVQSNARRVGKMFGNPRTTRVSGGDSATAGVLESAGIGRLRATTKPSEDSLAVALSRRREQQLTWDPSAEGSETLRRNRDQLNNRETLDQPEGFATEEGVCLKPRFVAERR